MLCNSKSGFPVFDSIESGFDNKHFVLCGGGGSAKSGVANRISLCTLGPRADGHAGVSLVQIAHFDTEANLATSCSLVNPTTVAFSIENEVVVTERCLGDRKDVLEERARHKLADNIEIVRCCHQRILLGTSKGQLVCFEWASNAGLKKVSTLLLHAKPVVDICAGPQNIVATASADDTCRIVNLETGKTESIIPSNSLVNLGFRRIRFSVVKEQPVRLYTLQVPKNRKGASYVVVWERIQRERSVFTWEISLIRQVSPLLVTAMAVSENGKFVVVGSADLSISILDATTLEPLKVVNKVHGLPVTGLFFRESYVVSTSADATCAMINVSDVGEFNIGKAIRALFSLLALLITIIAFVTCIFVSRGIDGVSARADFWEKLAYSSAPMNFSKVSPEGVGRFVNDFLWER